MMGELPIQRFITHEYEGIDKIQQLVDSMHEKDCLRAILKISDYEESKGINPAKVKVTNNVKRAGGV